MCRRGISALLALLLLLVVMAEDGPTVTLPDGRLRGKLVQTRGGRTVQAFLGIPYAKPPVGDLRFEPPQPAECWRPRELLVVSHPTPCPQLIDIRGLEDCLYLNVYTPHTSTRPRLPVMVFFPGGSYEIGAAYGYTHEFYLDEDIVFVVVQYRLGLFGFLSTGDEVVPGNMGLKDQRLALRWVQRNIRYFGGDPEEVTIAGESAGSVSVSFLLLFADNEGLFRAGISESGTALCSWALRPPQEVRFMVEVLAALSQCPAESVGFVKCLKSKPYLDLLFLYDFLYKNLVYLFVEIPTKQVLPLIGGVLEPECVEDRLITDNPWSLNVTLPWLVGLNSKEVLFIAPIELFDVSDAILLLYNAVFDLYFPIGLNYQNSAANGTLLGPAVRGFYLDFQPISRLTLSPFIDGLTDGVFTYGTYEAVLRANTEKTYVYFFDFITANEIFPIPPNGRIGAAHSDELWMFYEHPGVDFDNRLFENPEPDTTLSKIMVNMWVNFATCLDPTPTSSCAVQWEPFFPQESYLHIKQDGLYNESPFFPERMKFWQSQPFPIRDDHFGTIPCRRNDSSVDQGCSIV